MFDTVGDMTNTNVAKDKQVFDTKLKTISNDCETSMGKSFNDVFSSCIMEFNIRRKNNELFWLFFDTYEQNKSVFQLENGGFHRISLRSGKDVSMEHAYNFWDYQLECHFDENDDDLSMIPNGKEIVKRGKKYQSDKNRRANNKRRDMERLKRKLKNAEELEKTKR